MIVYPNAKINLGLNIVAKRPDGFHDIETCFLPVKLCDILEFIETDEETFFSSSGISIPGEISENICVKAWEIVRKNHNIPNVKIHLHKVIPIGAGLGGGSADGAFMLKSLSDYFTLNLSEQTLHEYASELGSDCPFFLLNSPAIGSGRGTELMPIELPQFDGHKIVLVNPGIHVSTGLAYSSVAPQKPEIPIHDLIKLPVDAWMGKIGNDFEKGVFQKFPEINEIKNKLIDLGASYAAMSGSGSTMFGIFKDEVPNKLKSNFEGSFVFIE